MKKMILLLMTGVVFCSSQAQKYAFDAFGYPVYDSVINYLSKRLDASRIDKNDQYRLAKKAGGWYFYLGNYYDSDKNSRWELCWSKEQKKYIYQGQENNTEQTAAAKKNLIRAWHDINFDLCPFYGYIGWTDDIINTYKDARHPTDAELDALARAYAVETMYQTSQEYSFEVPGKNFHLKDQAHSMTDSQVDTLRAWQHKANEIYYRLWKQNPRYETFVGNIWLKYSNEVSSLFLTLAYLQDMDEAMKEFKGMKIFDPFTIAFARNLLNSCKKDAILFVNGDSDTYPLLFVQATQHFRCDVLVVNQSLLGLSRYINFVRAGVFEATGFPMTMKPEQYAGTNMAYLHSDDSLYEKYSTVKGIHRLQNDTILPKNNVATIDMLNANEWKRPVYFSTTVDPKDFIGLEPYMVTEGMSYIVTTEASAAKNAYSSPVNTGFNYNYFMKTFETVNWSKQPYIDVFVRSSVENYEGTICRTANALADEQKLSQADSLLDFMVKAFPNEKIPYGVFMYTAPAIYAQCGDTGKGFRIAETMIENAHKLYDQTIDNNDLTPYEWEQQMRKALFVVQDLLDFYKQHVRNKKSGDKEDKFLNQAKLKYYEGLKKRKPE